MKDEIERINKLSCWYESKLNEINKAPVDDRPKMLRKLYRHCKNNKHFGVTITSFGTINMDAWPKYPPELEYPKSGGENIFYDSPTGHELPPGYKPCNYQKYFNQTIKSYQEHLIVDRKLVNSVHGLLGPKDRYMVNEVRDTIDTFKFKKDLVNLIVANLNGIEDYKLLGKYVKYKSSVLFHLLRLVGCDPNPDDFPLNGRVSNERTEIEIEAVFENIGWEYRPM